MEKPVIMIGMIVRSISTVLAVWLSASVAAAHPVPKGNHDRTIAVTLVPGVGNTIRVRIDYRLEVDEETVLLRDMRDYRDEVNFLDYFPSRAAEYYSHFTRIHAPIYADLMSIQVDAKSLPKLRCVSRRERLKDETGKDLGHLRCDLVFETEFDAAADARIRLVFHDQTYLSAGIAPERGTLALRFVNETGRRIESASEPSSALFSKSVDELDVKTEERQRRIEVVLGVQKVGRAKEKSPSGPGVAREAETPKSDTKGERKDTARPRPAHDDTFSLRRLIQENQYGFWLLLVVAFFFGAAHALTPGHGKTLVAAYLVGERGTIWHAMFLGLVTTLTHTGSVLILATIITVLPKDAQQEFEHWIENGLGLVLGLMIVCMGFWLLLQRLAGKADHFHIGGGHHHHHEGELPEAETPGARDLSWWGLVLLGVTGGIVPCGDAIMLFVYAVGTSHMWIVLPALLAFSAGLACVLVLIGVLVVQVPQFIEARTGDGRFLRALPTISAIAVIVVGLWLCYDWARGM